MPTVITHSLPPLALASGLGVRLIPPRLAAATAIAAMLPDLDTVSFFFGIRYAEALGHRGLSHSLVFALGVAAVAFFAAPLLRAKRLTAFLVVLFAMLSHIVLDAATNGGLGVAFFWPLDEARYFLPWRPIAVSPFSPKAFLTDQGLRVIFSELRWVLAPCLVFALAGFALRGLARFSGRFLRRGRV